MGPNIGEILIKVGSKYPTPPFFWGPHDYFARILKILRLEVKQEMNPKKNHGPNPRWSLLLYHSWRNKIQSSSLSCSCFSSLHDFTKKSRFLPISLVPLLLLYIAINQAKHNLKKQGMKTKRNIDLVHHFPNPTSLHHNCQEIKQQTNCKLFPPFSYSCFFPSQILRKQSKRKHTQTHTFDKMFNLFWKLLHHSSCFKIFHVHAWQNE